MNREDIIRMAREAKMFYQPQAGWIAELHHLERFAVLVAAAEREACAKVCDGMDHNGVMIAADRAAAIRARGQL